MARWAVIDEATGSVVNVIEWDGNAETWQPPEGHRMVEDTEGVVGPGFTFEDGEFRPPPGPEPPEPPSPFLPLSPRQIRLGLLHAGISPGMVTEALQGNEEGLIEWQYATRFERDHPLIEALAGSFGLTSDEIDEMWLAALEL